MNMASGAKTQIMPALQMVVSQIIKVQLATIMLFKLEVQEVQQQVPTTSLCKTQQIIRLIAKSKKHVLKSGQFKMQ